MNIANNLPKNALHKHVQRQYTPGIRFLLSTDEYLSRINEQDSDGNTALMLSVIHGYYKITELLINAQADVNIKNKDGLTPLMAAALNQDLDSLTLLLDNEADMNCFNKHNQTTLMLIVMTEDTYILKEFLKYEPTIIFNNNVETALDIAIKNKNKEIADLLLEIYGKELNEKILTHSVLKKDFIKINIGLKNLINSPATNKIICNKTNAVMIVSHIANIFETTALDLALYSYKTNLGYIFDLIDFSEILTSIGLLGELCDNICNKCKSPLALAINNDCFYTFNLMLKDKDLMEKTDEKGLTPLFLAISKGNENIVSELIKNGVNVNHISENVNVLVFAVTVGNLNIFKMLIDTKKVDSFINIFLVLHAMNTSKNPDIIQILINKNCNINFILKNNNSILMEAIELELWDISIILAKSSVPKGFKNSEGKDSLSLIKEKQNKYKNNQKISGYINNLKKIILKGILAEKKFKPALKILII